jgi:small subunit ribosomal protein S2
VAIVTMRELLEAGVHYGHHTSRWNPKMEPYIYKRRHSIHIVDLRETVRGIVRAYRFVSSVLEQGGEIILVGTKKQAKGPVEQNGIRGNVHYVNERWLGGTLTNFNQVVGRVKRLEELEKMEETGEIEAKGKKYAAVLRRERAKLRKNLQGIRNLKRTPDAMVVIDPRRERSAVHEATLLNIPIIGFQDTDTDPDQIDIVIPGNDDAMRSINLICSKLVDAVLEGKSRAPFLTGGAGGPATAEPVSPPKQAAPVGGGEAAELAAATATQEAPAEQPAEAGPGA